MKRILLTALIVAFLFPVASFPQRGGDPGDPYADVVIDYRNNYYEETNCPKTQDCCPTDGCPPGEPDNTDPERALGPLGRASSTPWKAGPPIRTCGT